MPGQVRPMAGVRSPPMSFIRGGRQIYPEGGAHCFNDGCIIFDTPMWKIIDLARGSL